MHSSIENTAEDNSVLNYMSLYKHCRLCPRNCGVDRTKGEKGFCRESDVMRIAWAGLHKGEEPPLSAGKGSGTVFFTGCTMQCCFCQNIQLSKGISGRETTSRNLADIFLKLENTGARNINIVTGTHFIPGIINSILLARRDGLNIPVVWNSSGFEKTEILEILKPYVDIWLPDIKTLDAELGEKIFKAPDYPEVVKSAVTWMLNSGSRGILCDFDSDAMEEKQVKQIYCILRHLVLPGHLNDTHSVLKWYSQNLHEGSILSLMTQYIPMAGARGILPDRKLSEVEIYNLMQLLEEYNIEFGFIQDPDDSETAMWIPDFDTAVPFPQEYAKRIWSWKAE